MSENVHVPVMLDEVENYLFNEDFTAKKVFDGTFGGGGYTKSFLEKGAQVWACDLDGTAIERFLGNSDENDLTLAESNYAEYITTFEDGFFDGIVLDLGFSSNQLAFSGRGFSYQNKEEILDLRYDDTRGLPAWKKMAKLKDFKDLGKVLYEYSGEKLAGKISRSLFEFRYDLVLSKKVKKGEGLTVGEVVDIIVEAIPKKFQNKTNAILSRIWQAMRIWVNNEFESIERFLPKAINKLKPGGRLCIVSFHSLEDKIITKFMRRVSKPITVDDYGNKEWDYELLTKKALKPSEDEVEANPRSRSAVLRVLRRVG